MTQLFTKKASLWFRGLAILMVLASHYAEWWEWLAPPAGACELLRLAISRLGPYGVAIFFLFSGYGLVHSAGLQITGFSFVKKRIFAVYLPYLLVVGILELFSGGFSGFSDVLQYLTGHDYWYMTGLFYFYIAFILLWALPANRHVHAFLFAAFTVLLSAWMYRNGDQSFWFVSNPAFAIGVFLAVYEPFFQKILDISRKWMPILLITGMAVSVYYGIFSHATAAWMPWKHVCTELFAVMIWTVLVIYMASVLRKADPVFPFLGNHSLYLYLTHQFLFMWVLNTFTETGLFLRFLMAAVITLLLSCFLGSLIPRIFQYATFLHQNKRSRTS